VGHPGSIIERHVTPAGHEPRLGEYKAKVKARWQLGRDAYRASQAAKRDAKEAAHEVEKAGKDFRQGWSEAKHDAETRQARHP